MKRAKGNDAEPRPHSMNELPNRGRAITMDEAVRLHRYALPPDAEALVSNSSSRVATIYVDQSRAQVRMKAKVRMKVKVRVEVEVKVERTTICSGHQKGTQAGRRELEPNRSPLYASVSARRQSGIPT